MQANKCDRFLGDSIELISWVSWDYKNRCSNTRKMCYSFFCFHLTYSSLFAWCSGFWSFDAPQGDEQALMLPISECAQRCVCAINDNVLSLDCVCVCVSVCCAAMRWLTASCDCCRKNCLTLALSTHTAVKHRWFFSSSFALASHFHVVLPRSPFFLSFSLSLSSLCFSFAFSSLSYVSYFYNYINLLF